jgi:hypothetical protein
MGARQALYNLSHHPRSIYQSIHPSFPSTCLSIHLPVYHPSICLSNHLSILPSLHPSIHVPIHLFTQCWTPTTYQSPMLQTQRTSEAFTCWLRLVAQVPIIPFPLVRHREKGGCSLSTSLCLAYWHCLSPSEWLPHAQWFHIEQGVPYKGSGSP